MAQLKSYLVSATFQMPNGHFRTVEMTLDCSGPQVVWDTLEGMQEDEGMDLVSARLREILDGGELQNCGSITVLPRKEQPKLPPPSDDAEPKGEIVPEKKAWYERPEFVSAYVRVTTSACTYKEKDDAVSTP